MRRHLSFVPAALSVLMLAGIANAEDPPSPEPPESGVTVRQANGARIVEAILPGHALSTVTVAGGGVLILIGLEDESEGQRSLYHFDPDADSLTLLADGLPQKLDTIDYLPGEKKILAGEPGKIYALGSVIDPATHRRPRLLVEAPDLDLGLLRRHRLITADRVFVPRPRLGRLDVYRWKEGSVDSKLLKSLDLPVRARRVRSGLTLSIPRVQLLEHGDLPRIAVGPEPQGKRRLLTTLLDPNAPMDPPPQDGAEQDELKTGVGEAWASFAANERIDQSWYLSIDDRPMLAVAALSADKLGIFEKKKLRLFHLRTDRTRAGGRPTLAIDTATRNWYDLGLHVDDLDGDGHDDLVVIQPDGLGAKKLAIEAYRGKGNGGFFLTPRRSVVVAPDAHWAFGDDFNDDGIGDLVAFADDRLSIFRGVGSTKKKGVIDKTPRWSLEMTQLSPRTEVEVHVGGGPDSDSDADSDDLNLGRPQVVDLDGDGRTEILIEGDIGERAVLRAIFLE